MRVSPAGMWNRAARVLGLTGTAVERGRQTAEVLGGEIAALHANLRSVKYAGFSDPWAWCAERSLPLIERHAPTAWRELQGLIEGGVDPQVAAELVADYDAERGMYSPAWCRSWSRTAGRGEPNMCTTFGIAHGDRLVTGQNNDELPQHYHRPGSEALRRRGRAFSDLIVRIDDVENDMEVVAYTHPGYPAKMGMNSFGLSVQSLYIDDGHALAIGDAVPFIAIVR